MLGWPGAAAAAVLGALSPWHLAFSRFGQEAITGSATVTFAILCFLGWVSWRKTGYMPARSSLDFLSTRTRSSKLFAPLMIGLLAILYWRELRQSWAKALIALGVIGVLVAPEAIFTLRHRATMQARYNQMSLFHYMENCPGCVGAAARHRAIRLWPKSKTSAANWAGYLPRRIFLLR